MQNYEKATATILNDESLKALPLRSEIRQDATFSTPIQHGIISLKQSNKIKGKKRKKKILEKNIKLSVYRCIKFWRFHKNTIKANKFRKPAGYKIMFMVLQWQ